MGQMPRELQDAMREAIRAKMRRIKKNESLYQEAIHKLKEVAEKYGYVVLAPDRVVPDYVVKVTKDEPITDE